MRLFKATVSFWFFMNIDFYLHVSCLEQGANNVDIMGSVPVWATHLRAALDDPSGSLQLRLFCDSVK